METELFEVVDDLRLLSIRTFFKREIKIDIPAPESSLHLKDLESVIHMIDFPF